MIYRVETSIYVITDDDPDPAAAYTVYEESDTLSDAIEDTMTELMTLEFTTDYEGEALD